MMNKVKLKRHNVETYNIIKEAYTNRNHIGVVQATGTGKSYLIANTIEDMGFKKVLFLTSSLYIINEFKDSFKHLNNKVHYMTYKKLAFVKNIREFLNENNYDFIVLDEYHRCGARTWYKPVKCILENSKDIKVLGVTATPIRFLDCNRDMTKELFDSEPIVEISLLNAIKNEVLPRPKYILSYYNIEDEVENIRLKNLNYINEDNTLKNINYMINNITALTNMENVLSKNINDERKFIVFCSGISHIKKMSTVVSKWFNNIGYKTEKYFAYRDKDKMMTTKDIELEIERFKNSKRESNKIDLMFVVNILNEGIHIDSVDGLIFLRKTISPTIVYQQLGRCLKSNYNKIPVIFDFVSNIKSLSFNEAGNAYKEKHYSKYNLFGKSYGLDSNIKIIDYTEEIDNLLKEIEKLSRLKSWKAFIDILVEYKTNHGTCNLPSSHPLYKRCVSLRHAYKNGNLDKNKFKELNDLGFEWNIDIYDDERWNFMFDKLLKFKKEFNHTNVPRSYIDKQLATWVHTQRKYRNSLLQDRKERLLSIGFEFEIAKSRNDKEWKDMFSKLLDFKNTFGHVNVSSRYEDKKLANWVNSQRKAYKAGKLDNFRYENLISVGFIFSKK